MIEMHVVGRADHQEIELFGSEELLRRTIGRAGRDAVFRQSRQPRRIRIDVTDNLEAAVDSLEDIAKIAEPESQPNDSHFHAKVVPNFVIYFLQVGTKIRGRQPKTGL